MPLVGAAAITVGGAVAGGVIKSKAAGRAAKAQQASTQAALDYEKQNQASRQARYDAAMEDYNKRYDAWLEQFYGVKPSGGGAAGAGGVHAFAAGVPSGAMGAAPYQAVSPHQNGNSIAQLLLQMGQQQGDAANASGDIWGDALTEAGSGFGSALKNRQPKPQATMTPGGFQTIGMTPAETGMTPYQPAQFGQEGGWNDWRKYLGTGQVF